MNESGFSRRFFGLKYQTARTRRPYTRFDWVPAVMTFTARGGRGPALASAIADRAPATRLSQTRHSLTSKVTRGLPSIAKNVLSTPTDARSQMRRAFAFGGTGRR